MKKENFGIPATLLKLTIYTLALYISVNYGANIWIMLAATIAVFALGFDASVKKTAVQATALVLIFIGANLVFDFFGYFFSFANGVDYTGESVYSKYNDIVGVINKVFDITAYVLYVLLALMALVKKDLFVGPVYKAVDGFVPKPAPQPQYNTQPQYNGQPQQYAQPQYNGQPQQYAQPQYNGQPQFDPQTGQPIQPQQQPQQPNNQ